MTDFDYHTLDEIIHSRIRLAIMAALISVDKGEFTFLRDQIKTTDGNLSTHLRKLEDAGYITVEKKFVNRKPVSLYSLTEEGRLALQKYVERLQDMIPQNT